MPVKPLDCVMELEMEKENNDSDVDPEVLDKNYRVETYGGSADEEELIC